MTPANGEPMRAAAAGGDLYVVDGRLASARTTGPGTLQDEFVVVALVPSLLSLALLVLAHSRQSRRLAVAGALALLACAVWDSYSEGRWWR